MWPALAVAFAYLAVRGVVMQDFELGAAAAATTYRAMSIC